MFDYKLPEGRPNGRLRTQPEIQATLYSRHMPEKQVKISRTEYIAEWTKYALDKCPSPGEAMMWVWFHSPYIVAAGAIAVSAADQTFDLGLADKMAGVEADKDDGSFEQTLEQIVHDIGASAGGEEK